ncbi:MAG: nodulation protein NfeD [Kiritimatiellales bacterium]|nr:nodulation protein NfeD [Kiritimatiellota bacterium]MBL7015980.1 nodulation protein NfeD [Kiritimatiellales bacterium]
MKAKRIVFALLALLVFPTLGKSEDNFSNPPPQERSGMTGVRSSALVYQIPIENQIEPALLYVIRRGVAEASKVDADAIIFTMDTPGGRVDVTRDILEIIREIDVPVYTFVERDAYSAGAIIALATPHIYMAPGSVIGAATPILMGPTGGVQDLNEDVGEKMKSGVAAMVRAAAEQGGHSPELAEAMVRRETEYKIGTNIVSKAGELLTLTASEAEGVLSEGTVEDLDALLEAIGLPGAEIKKLEVTPAEKLARVIAAIAPILLMIGLGGIYLEIKTPGVGLPGITGAAALVLFFFGHHIAGLAGMEDVVIFIIGFTLLFIEVFITPGFGVLGISGIALILVSLLNAMSWQVPGEILPAFSGGGATIQHAITNLALGMAGTVVLAVAAGRFLPKSRVVRPLVLSQSTDRASGFSAAHDHSELLGKEGVAEMNLHPAGRALFDGQLVNVITHGEFIEKGSAIKVVEAHGSRIVVETA